jgi:hypothetical protein
VFIYVVHCLELLFVVVGVIISYGFKGTCIVWLNAEYFLGDDL